jgi:hypothetical protein
MVWTKEETELINILDEFVENCSQSYQLKNINCHRLIRQILSETQGEVEATQKYCQQVLNAEQKITNNQKVNLEDLLKGNFLEKENYSAIPPITSTNSVNSLTETWSRTQNFKSFWTILFILCSSIAIFFTAQKSPNLNSLNTYSNIAIFCPANLIETAQTGIRNHDRAFLLKAIAGFQQLKKQQANQLGLECEQILWETQFIYAIDFLASQGRRKEAVKNLCKISTQYFQNKEVIPWFTRWSNTNQNFSQWLTKYKANNSCPVASYLE